MNNFTINTEQDTITVQPKSQTKVNIIFNPSSIGSGDEQQHQSKISFINDKVCIGNMKQFSFKYTIILDFIKSEFYSEYRESNNMLDLARLVFFC
jgi:hypothetical protein